MLWDQSAHSFLCAFKLTSKELPYIYTYVYIFVLFLIDVLRSNFSHLSCVFPLFWLRHPAVFESSHVMKPNFLSASNLESYTFWPCLIYMYIEIEREREVYHVIYHIYTHIYIYVYKKEDIYIYIYIYDRRPSTPPQWYGTLYGSSISRKHAEDQCF